MRTQLIASLACLVGASVTVAACSPAGGTPTPSSTTPPPRVERTVAAGTTLQTDRSAQVTRSGAASGPMPGMSMPGMSMPGPSTAARPSIVPNGSGPHVVAAPDVDGCNRVYGSLAQCVPLHAPGGGPLTCAVLREYHYLPLLVTKDPLGLLSRKGSTTRVKAGKRYLTGCST